MGTLFVFNGGERGVQARIAGWVVFGGVVPGGWSPKGSFLYFLYFISLMILMS